MKNIGILGGAFNPIHNGHLYIAYESLLQADLDEIWIMPTGISPHKQNAAGATRFDRYNMCLSAFDTSEMSPGDYLSGKDVSRFHVINTEIMTDTKNYTYQTLHNLKNKYPQNNFYFIIGEDSLDEFNSWVHPEEICRYADIIAAVRSTESAESDKSMRACADNISKKYSCRVILIKTVFKDFSSTDIRNLLNKQNLSAEEQQYLTDALPSSVLRYITAHHCYEVNYWKEPDLSPKDINSLKSDPRKLKGNTTFAKRKKEIEKELQKTLKPGRYEHTLGVAYTASALAMRYSYPMEKACIAGLLHDCAKYMSPEELLKYCEKNRIAITESEREMPQLLHAKAGAYKAANDYDVKDEEILHAITVHTTGCPNMSLLDKIVFTADYIEPNRDQATRLEEIRTASFINLDQAIEMILKDTIAYLQASGKKMDSATEETLKYYEKELNLKQ